MSNEPRPRVVVAIPTTGDLHHACAVSIREMIRATRSAEEVAFWWDHDQPHDRCRNGLIDRFMGDGPWTHLLFVDSDVTVEPDTVDRFLAHDVPLVCAPVPTLNRRYGPPTEPRGATVGTNIMVFDDPSLRGGVVEPERPDAGYRRVDPDDLPGEPFTCDSTGLGLCLIRRDVFESIERPWCLFIGQFEGETVGEDVYFFRQARAAGFELVVDPSIRCDHYKHIDLTHLDLLYSDRIPISAWPRLQEPDESRNVLVAVRVPRTGWLHVRLMDCLEAWERRLGERVRIECLFADSVRGGFMELEERMHSIDDRFSHILLLGDDVIPLERMLGLLASVDGPVVSALTRRLIDGKICWAYWCTDPVTGELVAPQNIKLPELHEPFEVVAADPACMLIERQTLGYVSSAVRNLSHGPEADTLFVQRWCAAVTEGTGRAVMQVPMTIERRSEVGLAGLLNIKMNLKAQYRARMQDVGSEPAPAPF